MLDDAWKRPTSTGRDADNIIPYHATEESDSESELRRASGHKGTSAREVWTKGECVQKISEALSRERSEWSGVLLQMRRL